MSERSGIMSSETARALAGGLPPRFRMSSWSLLYSTERHGISLQTLYRRCNKFMFDSRWYPRCCR